MIDKFDALVDIFLETLDTSLDQVLLLFVDVLQRIGSSDGTGILMMGFLHIWFLSKISWSISYVWKKSSDF